MVEGQLVLHRGAREVSLSELGDVTAPPATETWFPISHCSVLHSVTETLGNAGFVVQRERLALSADNARFFGVLDLQAELSNGVNLSVGVRNSIDKSFPLGFCAGSRVFACDNLAFRAELLVARKHTMHGGVRFREAIARAVGSLPQFQATEIERIAAMREREIEETHAEALMLRAYENGLVSHLVLPEVIKQWRTPAQEDFAPRTLWSLFNAFTGALQSRAKSNPQAYALQSMRINALLAPEALAV